MQVHGQLGAAFDEMRLVGREILELGQIGAGAEGHSRAGEHDAAHVVGRFGGMQGVEQRLRELVVEGVALVGAVHGEDAHALTIFDQQLGHGMCLCLPSLRRHARA